MNELSRIGPNDGDEAPEKLPPLKPGEMEVVDLGDKEKLIVIGTSDGDRMVRIHVGGEGNEG